MRAVALFLTLTLSCVSGQTLTKAERDFAVQHLKASAKEFVDSIWGLTDAQWQYRPSPNERSPAESAECVIQSDSIAIETTRLLRQPATPGRRSSFTDQQALKYLYEAGRREKPATLKAAPPKLNSAEAVLLFGQKRAEIVKYIETNRDNLRGYVIGRIDNPPDVYQVLLWLVGHAEGHAAQIRATRASPGFPK